MVPAFVETARDSLFSPADFFRSMMHGRGIADALLYGVLVGWLGQMVASFYQLILHSVVGSSFSGGDEIPEALRVVMSQFEGLAGFLFAALFGWFFVAVGLFIWSGLVHLALLASGGAKRDFEASFSVACYSESALLWNVVPFCGGVAAIVHWLVLNTIGLSEAHGISRGQALVAVLVPLLLCCCCIPGLGVALVGGLGAMIAGVS